MASDAAMLRALGKRVRDLRHARGLSQERLAELASIHENHVRRMEARTANRSYAVLVPHVLEIKRLKSFSRRKKAAQAPGSPQSPAPGTPAPAKPEPQGSGTSGSPQA